MKKNKWFLNGGRGSGKTFRLLCEVYENKIAELEQENKVLAQNLEDTEIVNKALEKENAELKAEKGCETCTKFDEVQLTEAKEIIREFVEWATWQGSNCPNFKSIQDKAEQFLNSEEK